MPLENPYTLQECFDLMIEKINAIEDEFEQSLFSLVHLSYLQAFEDVNKRTARLVANIPLIKKNLKPLSFIDVDQEAYVKSLLGVYEKNDVSLIADFYMWAYTRSSQRTRGAQVVSKIQTLIDSKDLPGGDRAEVFQLVETEIMSLHEGNVARFKIRPSEYIAWKKLQ